MTVLRTLVPTMARIAHAAAVDAATTRLRKAKTPYQRRRFALELDALVKAGPR